MNEIREAKILKLNSKRILGPSIPLLCLPNNRRRHRSAAMQRHRRAATGAERTAQWRAATARLANTSSSFQRLPCIVGFAIKTCTV